MTCCRASGPSRSRLRPRWRRQRLRPSPLLAASALSLFGFLAVGLAGARPATAADATMSPFVPGHHVYDYGNLLSAHSVKTAEALAAHIEAAGGGRVVLYTAAIRRISRFTLAQDWSIDGLLLTGEGDYGIITMGATLKGKLGAQAELLEQPVARAADVESWMLTHAGPGRRVRERHARLRRRRDPRRGRQAAGRGRGHGPGGQLGAPVYVDIAIGGDDPSSDCLLQRRDDQRDLGKCS